MAYIPDPTDTTQPVLTTPAGTAAAEFRALKAYIQTLLATVGIGGLNMYRKNILHNGDMAIDQRFEGTTSANNTISSTFPSYLVDRWYGGAVVSVSGQVKPQRLPSTLVPGSVWMLDYNITGVGSFAAAEYWTIEQTIEANDIASLLYGTPQAKALSLSFLCSSPVAGVHTVSIRNAAKNRSYVATYIIPVPNTPTFITINNILGDTAGIWPFAQGVAGMVLSFDMGSSPVYEAPASGSWNGGSFTRMAGAARPIGTIGHFRITHVQLEQAAAASQFDYLFPTVEKLICKRYFNKSYSEGNILSTDLRTQALILNNTLNRPGFGSVNPMQMKDQFPVSMRITPTVVVYSPTGDLTGICQFYSPVAGTFAAGAVGVAPGNFFSIDNVVLSFNSNAVVNTHVCICYYANSDFY